MKSKKRNPFNEKFKGDIKFAQEVKNTYNILLSNLSMEATLGSKEAALSLMKKMAEENIILYHLGFKITDNGRLINL